MLPGMGGARSYMDCEVTIYGTYENSAEGTTLRPVQGVRAVWYSVRVPGVRQLGCGPQASSSMFCLGFVVLIEPRTSHARQASSKMV